jgi:uracil-DNA glycosylase
MTSSLFNNSWDDKLKEEFEKPYFQILNSFIKKERNEFIIYPKEDDVYNALKWTSFENLKVVIIGQDPYHGAHQAHGLSFSVNHGIKTPPSLKNIFKELHSDIGCKLPNHGNLTSWATQGVLLLNATLTVQSGKPGSHQNKGWETFTDTIIKLISDEKQNCVFLLWGNYAKNKHNLINTQKHLVLEAAHPSPLARGAFFGCKHFSKTNEYLKSHQLNPIDWNLSIGELFE